MAGAGCCASRTSTRRARYPAPPRASWPPWRPSASNGTGRSATRAAPAGLYRGRSTRLRRRGLAYSPAPAAASNSPSEGRYPGTCRRGPVRRTADRDPAAGRAAQHRPSSTTGCRAAYRQDVAAAVGDLIAPAPRRDLRLSARGGGRRRRPGRHPRRARRGPARQHAARRSTCSAPLACRRRPMRTCRCWSKPDGGKLAKSRRSVALEPARARASCAQSSRCCGMTRPPDLAAPAAQQCLGLGDRSLEIERSAERLTTAIAGAPTH